MDTVLHIIAFGPKHYFGNKWYVLDGFVVFVTAVLEFVVHPLVHVDHSSDSEHARLLSSDEDSSSSHSSAETTTEAIAALLIIMRTWRFIRLVHGVAFSEKLRNDEIHKLEKEERMLETELTHAVEHDGKLASENERLKKRVLELEKRLEETIEKTTKV
ncbi:hypothetical protein TrRE_jg11233 [Triparma retinervis]|uniref:Voltage-gated hydrogen channel 1 n=1 Tax=Triparma retinervis TaxID=2557542 RepID=A0A9W7DW36_9STRA|nr:hypothetical protein TrRE_jg11233 [Triparma retinervis]